MEHFDDAEMNREINPDTCVGDDRHLSRIYDKITEEICVPGDTTNSAAYVRAVRWIARTRNDAAQKLPATKPTTLSHSP